MKSIVGDDFAFVVMWSSSVFSSACCDLDFLLSQDNRVTFGPRRGGSDVGRGVASKTCLGVTNSP